MLAAALLAALALAPGLRSRPDAANAASPQAGHAGVGPGASAQPASPRGAGPTAAAAPAGPAAGGPARGAPQPGGTAAGLTADQLNELAAIRHAEAQWERRVAAWRAQCTTGGACSADGFTPGEQARLAAYGRPRLVQGGP